MVVTCVVDTVDIYEHPQQTNFNRLSILSNETTLKNTDFHAGYHVHLHVATGVKIGICLIEIYTNLVGVYNTAVNEETAVDIRDRQHFTYEVEERIKTAIRCFLTSATSKSR